MLNIGKTEKIHTPSFFRAFARVCLTDALPPSCRCRPSEHWRFSSHPPALDKLVISGGHPLKPLPGGEPLWTPPCRKLWGLQSGKAPSGRGTWGHRPCRPRRSPASRSAGNRRPQPSGQIQPAPRTSIAIDFIVSGHYNFAAWPKSRQQTTRPDQLRTGGWSSPFAL